MHSKQYCGIAVNDLHWRSDQKVEYFPLSASSSTTTSNLLPTADNAETKLRRARNRPRKKERIVSVVCCVVLLEGPAPATLHGNIRSATKATWSACSLNAASPELRPCQEAPLAELETGLRTTDRERERERASTASPAIHTSNTTTHASCAKLYSLTNTSPHNQNGTRHFLGRASPVHQLGCAPQARHSLESGARQLRSSDCGMISCCGGQIPWTKAENSLPTGHCTSSSRTSRRPQQTGHSSHIPW
jgi:hypothetical protein